MNTCFWIFLRLFWMGKMGIKTSVKLRDGSLHTSMWSYLPNRCIKYWIPIERPILKIDQNARYNDTTFKHKTGDKQERVFFRVHYRSLPRSERAFFFGNSKPISNETQGDFRSFESSRNSIWKIYNRNKNYHFDWVGRRSGIRCSRPPWESNPALKLEISGALSSRRERREPREPRGRRVAALRLLRVIATCGVAQAETGR